MSIYETVSSRPAAKSSGALLKYYGSTFLGQGFTLGIGTLTGILSARILGPAGRGEYAAIIIWPTAIASFLAFGINQALVFHMGRRTFTTSEVATAITVIGLIQSALSIIIGLAIVPFALAKYTHSVQHLAILFVLVTPMLIFSMYPANLFQGVQDLVRFNLIRLIAPATYAAALVGLYVTHQATLNSVILSQLFGYILALVLGLILVRKILTPSLQWNGSAIPVLFHYGRRLQGLSVATYFNQRIDQLVLSLLVPPQQLGFYAVAVTLSMAVAIFPQAVGIVTLSRVSSQQHEDARETIGVAFRASLIWLVVTCSALYVLAPFLIRLVFGRAFDGSIVACRILIPGALMTGLSFVLYNAASALGRPELASYAEGTSVLITAAGLYMLVPHYGYIGAAIVSSAAYTISFTVMLVLAHRCLGLSVRSFLLSRSPHAKSGTTDLASRSNCKAEQPYKPL